MYFIECGTLRKLHGGLSHLKFVNMATTSKKRTDLTLEEKIAVLDRFHAMEKTSQRNAAIALGISRGQLQNLLKNEGAIRAENPERRGMKRKRAGKDEDVEKALFEWWEFGNRRHMPVSGPILCQKAEDLARKAGHDQFRATDGWFS